MVLVFIANSYCGHTQIKKENLKLGFAYGTGSQNKFPFNVWFRRISYANIIEIVSKVFCFVAKGSITQWFG